MGGQVWKSVVGDPGGISIWKQRGAMYFIGTQTATSVKKDARGRWTHEMWNGCDSQTGGPTVSPLLLTYIHVEWKSNLMCRENHSNLSMVNPFCQPDTVYLSSHTWTYGIIRADVGLMHLCRGDYVTGVTISSCLANRLRMCWMNKYYDMFWPMNGSEHKCEYSLLELIGPPPASRIWGYLCALKVFPQEKSASH